LGTTMSYSTGEITFLVIAVGLFTTFAVVLAYQAWKDPQKPD